MKNKIIPYNPILKEYARQLRKNSTLAEVLLWQKIKQKALGVQFHRQVPMLDYIVDFYCHELGLAIEVDGDSHEYKYEYDAKRQGILEKHGVEFIRFSDEDIKSNMFSVGLILEEKVQELLGIHLSKDITNPNIYGGSKEKFIEEKSRKPEGTPLRSPQGDNFRKQSNSQKQSFKFPKKEKLKSKKLFDALFAKGKQITDFPVKLIYIKAEMPVDVKIQVGFAVPKKNFKSAVKRNRIKRLLREGYRLNKHLIFNNIEGNFAFLFLYLGKEMPSYQEVEKGVKTILQKLKAKESDEKVG